MIQSHKDQFLALLPAYIADPAAHAKWLNTLSYLENCGARKIARTEHPRDVSKEMLKHAAEEFRHAFYLKQQIATKLKLSLLTYQKNMLLGGHETLRYLDRLETQICRLLKKQQIAFTALKHHAYLLVTYVIELRASELYPIYQQLLTQAKSPVSVRSILLEEKGHLQEMEKELAALQVSDGIIASCCAIEGELCGNWLCLLKETSSRTDMREVSIEGWLSIHYFQSK